jgi:inhibitor of KinA
MNNYRIFGLSDDAVTFSLGNSINTSNTEKLVAMKSWLEKQNVNGILDLIIAYSTLTLIYDVALIKTQNSRNTPSKQMRRLLKEAFKLAGDVGDRVSNHWDIPVCYSEEFGPDLNALALSKKLTVENIVEIHSSKIYTVFMIGFLPGFPYLGALDKRLEVSRRMTPRPRVEPGSVGLAGLQTGIYPVASPGGWQVIGRTPVSLFDPGATVPVKIEIGDTVQFSPISEDQFRKQAPSQK